MTSPNTSGPRIVAPDVARGLALLGIAWANVSTGWNTSVDMPAIAYGGVVDGSVVDKIFVVLSAMFAHVRGLPMFTTLLGFGIGLITMSQWRKGSSYETARSMLWRRYGWLAAFGAVHCIFFFYGDIMLVYGLLALVLIAMLKLKNKTLLVIAAILYAVNILWWGVLALLSLKFDGMNEILSMEMTSSQTYLGYLGTGLATALLSPFTAFSAMWSLLPLMILGFVAARLGVHRDVAKYAKTLRLLVALTIAVILLVGLPLGLGAIGVMPQAVGLFEGFNQAFGYLTGPGIAAGVLLACQGLQQRAEDGATFSWPLRAVIALGKRSMSGYLAQSVLFLTLTQSFTLNLLHEQGAAMKFCFAAAVWVVTLVCAALLEAAGKPGPFEKLHRRLSYGRIAA
ncbi:DUF418 domain-containing protein [Corynebacterium tapiri]|uniref:DUF418 domain-containing protein n=1 Tax=Corynebacterium tapiri TaxID=1448266 RepID=A0A5C4U4V9_9CORY|nr:DUF418 domain-containing protein [Corynebacterium tapiri]TNL99199.1 DUF418 domain-containing protein [Corynebacterium tapiri]